MKLYKKITLSLFVIMFVAIGVFGLTSGHAYAATPSKENPKCKETNAFLTFPSWFRGIVDRSTCQIESPATANGDTKNNNSGDIKNFIYKIALNVIDIILQVVGYITAGFILYGGFLFLSSTGEAAAIAKAKTTITNAVVGLLISIGSVAIVNLVFGIINTNTTVNSYGFPELSAGDAIGNLLGIFYFVAGITAVIVIISAGFIYATSNGSAAQVARAKNAILYSAIGLIVVAFAFVITQFILGRF